MTKSKTPTKYAAPIGDKKIVCLKCGNSTQNNFFVTRDPCRSFFGKIPYCKSCIKDMYMKYFRKYNDMNLSIYYLCRKVDIPYIHSAYTGAVENINNENAKIKGDDAIISAYIKNLSFSDRNGWGNSFDDSQGEKMIDGITSFAEITKIKRNPSSPKSDNDKYDIIEYDTDELIQRWGLFDHNDLAYLQSEYLDWEEKLNGITEKSTDIMVKQVCLQCNEIRKDRESDINVDKKVKTLQDLLKTSGLLDTQDPDAEVKHVGMLIHEIENRRPIKEVDPDLKDVDEIREIIAAFRGSICRALGKENAYTNEFDDAFEQYSIDLINELDQKHSEENGGGSDG